MLPPRNLAIQLIPLTLIPAAPLKDSKGGLSEPSKRPLLPMAATPRPLLWEPEAMGAPAIMGVCVAAFTWCRSRGREGGDKGQGREKGERKRGREEEGEKGRRKGGRKTIRLC